MGDAVESVAADVMAVRKLQRQRVEPGRVRQAAMKGRVEDRHHRDPRAQHCPRPANAGQAGRIVQGSQFAERINLLLHRIGDDHRLGEPIATMHHAVPDGLDRAKRTFARVLRGVARQAFDYPPQGLDVVMNLPGVPNGALLQTPDLERGSPADALHRALGDGASHLGRPSRFYPRDVEETELQRRTPAVEYKNPHVSSPPCRSRRGKEHFAV